MLPEDDWEQLGELPSDPSEQVSLARSSGRSAVLVLAAMLSLMSGKALRRPVRPVARKSSMFPFTLTSPMFDGWFACP